MNKSKMKPILPLSGDVVFKGFFSDKKHTKYLIDLLNHYTDVEIKNGEAIEVVSSEETPQHAIDKRPRLDLRVRTAKGEYVNVEMQVEKYEHLLKRVQYYNHKIFATQLCAGDDYGKLAKVVSLVFIDKELDIFKGDAYINHIVYSHKESDIIYDEMGTFIFVAYNSTKNHHDIWSEILAAKTEKDFLRLEKRGGIMAEVIEELRLFSQDEKIRFQQEMYDKYELDQLYLKRQARREGLTEGKIAGQAEAVTQIAKRMLSMNYPLKDIVKITGLTESDLNALH